MRKTTLTIVLLLASTADARPRGRINVDPKSAVVVETDTTPMHGGSPSSFRRGGHPGRDGRTVTRAYRLDFQDHRNAGEGPLMIVNPFVEKPAEKPAEKRPAPVTQAKIEAPTPATPAIQAPAAVNQAPAVVSLLSSAALLGGIVTVCAVTLRR